MRPSAPMPVPSASVPILAKAPEEKRIDLSPVANTPSDRSKIESIMNRDLPLPPLNLQPVAQMPVSMPVVPQVQMPMAPMPQSPRGASMMPVSFFPDAKD
ncbi:Uncharacterised protein [uncultured archaeon]|nr:Uncharacterised protein [uncultured archaeon]